MTDINPALQYLGLEPIPTVDEVITNAHQRGLASEAVAKNRRESLSKAVRRATAASAFILAATHPTIQEGLSDVAGAAKNMVTTPIVWANNRMNEDPTYRDAPDFAPDVVRHSQTEGADAYDKLVNGDQ